MENMENKSNNCSAKDHQEIKAISFCQECRLYMCENCKKIHLDLYNHHLLDLNDENQDMLLGICKENNHNYNLEYFCKTHNKLICLACIASIKKKGNGQHKNCKICIIEDIKEEKTKNLKENILILENLYNSVKESLENLKKNIEDVNIKKEEMKINIQKIFTKIRNELNNREDELLLKIDKKFDNLVFKESSLKDYEKSSKKIKFSFNEKNLVDKERKDENIISLINECINVENNIKNLKQLNNDLKKNDFKKIYNVDHNFQEEQTNKFIKSIYYLGDIYYNFEFENSTDEKQKYILSGEIENIITKNVEDKKWLRILSKSILKNKKEYSWKIKILNSKNKEIMVGVAQKETKMVYENYNYNMYAFPSLVIDSSEYLIDFLNKENKNGKISNLGWYFRCSNSKLYSDAPQNFRDKKYKLIKIIDEIKIIMNMEKGTLKFIVGNEDKGEIYENIPINEPIVPAVLLYDNNDSVQIIPC